MEENIDITEKKQNKCDICNKTYNNKSGLWYHNQKYHSQNNQQLNVISCEFCKKIFSRIDNLKRHQIKCKEKHEKNEKEKQLLYNKLKEDIKSELKKDLQLTNKNTKIINNTIINGNNNTNNNLNFPNITINKPGTEDINRLSFEEVNFVLNNELSGVMNLIDLLNFNENNPEDHSINNTAFESAYLSIFNSDTKKIDKERKRYFFESIICKNIQNHEFLFNKYKDRLDKDKISKIEETIAVLKKIKDESFSSKIMLEMIRNLNILSYNKREIVQKTWSGKNNEDIADKKFMELILSDPESQRIIAAEKRLLENFENNKMKLLENKDTKINDEKDIEYDFSDDSVKKTFFF
jgi:hypothetical protein